MALSFVETDTAAPLGTLQACSAFAVGTTVPLARLAEIGGTAGSASTVVTCAASTNASFVMLQMQPNTTLWQAGVFSWPINVTVANSNLQWRRFYVCRLNSGGTSLATIASNLTVNNVFSSTGVKTATATAGADTTVDSTDILYYVATFLNGAASSQSCTLVFNQTTTTPIVLRDGIPQSTLAVNHLGMCSLRV